MLNLKNISLSIIILSSLTCSGQMTPVSSPINTDIKYQVIKVIDGDTIYIDFNKDGFPQKEEKVRINGIDTFEVKPSKFLDCQMKTMNLSQDEALGLGYLGKEFAKKHLLNKYVVVKYTGNKKFCDMGRHLMSIWYDNGKSYEQEILKAGLGIVYRDSNIADNLYQYENIDKIKKNAKKSHSFNLVLLNKKNGKYHKPTCEYGLISSDAELVKRPFRKYQGAGCCYPKQEKRAKNIWMNNKTSHSIDLMFNYPYYKHPSTKVRTKSAKILLYELQNETKSLDFMMYGIYGQPDIFNEIIYLCHKPNIKLRGIVDVNTKGENDYADTHKLKSLCYKIKTDFAQKDEMQSYYNKQKKLGYLMHNKVFIFSNNHVWTGSTNISSTCSGGYNANVSYLIKDRQVADLYRQEITQMYEKEKFHTDKEKIVEKNILLSDGTLLSIYFAPNERIIYESILPSFSKAKKYIYVGMFYFTNKKIIEELINAQKRGVDVKIIVDASFANNYRHYINIMRQEGIKVKVENWGGKMHCKLAIIDDETVLTGSLNWTKSAISFNDENFLEIKSQRIANETKNYFKNLWRSIPDKWLKEIPLAEGLDSSNSCNDGIDNDHNGLTDKADPKCIKNLKMVNK